MIERSVVLCETGSFQSTRAGSRGLRLRFKQPVRCSRISPHLGKERSSRPRWPTQGARLRTGGRGSEAGDSVNHPGVEDQVSSRSTNITSRLASSPLRSQSTIALRPPFHPGNSLSAASSHVPVNSLDEGITRACQSVSRVSSANRLWVWEPVGSRLLTRKSWLAPKTRILQHIPLQLSLDWQLL